MSKKIKTKAKNVPLPLSVPEDLKAFLENLADENRRSTNAQAIVIIEAFKAQYETQKQQQKKG